MNSIMTVLTNDKRFSSPSRHPFDPGGFFWPSLHVEVGQLTNMVDFDVRLASAHFTGICKQSFDEFAAWFMLTEGAMFQGNYQKNESERSYGCDKRDDFC
jgi:hypothetical protein